MRQQISFAAVVLVVACGNPGKPTDQPPANIEVRPSAVQLVPAGAQQFALSPSTVSVTWTVTEGTSGGTVTQAGFYTAPGYSGLFHVVATSTANPSVSGQAAVNVSSPYQLTVVSPVTVAACDSIPLSATVTGAPDNTVLWSTAPSCGSVTTAGVFKSLRGTGTCMVTATLQADIGRVAAITVNVTAERVITVAVTPDTVPTVLPAGGQQFSATVTTSCGQFPAGT